MNYTFKDFHSKELFSENLRVLIVAGSYSIFNNMVCDKVRAMCKGSDTPMDKSLLAEFGIDADEVSTANQNILDIETFKTSIGVTPYSGKWYCNTPLNALNSKQKEWVKNYIKNPSSNGILVLQSTEYREFAEYLRDKDLNTSKVSHIIQLSFPDREILKNIIKDKFSQNGINIQQPEIETFMFRMSIAYDDYDSVITNISVEFSDGHTLTKKELLNSLHGINNCVIDDFIEKLLVPFKTDTPTSRKAIFHMLGALTEEYGADSLCRKLLKQIEIYIEFRQQINKGNIPVLVRYSVKEARERIGENSILSKVSDFRFRKMAFTASRTTLRDWVYMKMILSNTTRFSSRSYEEALYRLTVRSTLTQSTLNLGINSNKLAYSLMDCLDSKLNKVEYSEENLKRAKELEETAREK